MEPPPSLARDISPPRPLKRRRTSGQTSPSTIAAPIAKSDQNSTYGTSLVSEPAVEPTLAAVEAGKAKIDDHLTYFRNHLAKTLRRTDASVPRLSIDEFSTLYHNNQHDHGHHFVIHQHNHPKAGVHYDLRLQFSESSSMSFAVPKGLPGNPNSRSVGRMAIETRVHNYWNHLIESASAKTGSLLIWDTGTYEVLPRTMKKSGIPSPQTTDDEAGSDVSDVRRGSVVKSDKRHENEKLISAFQTRYIRLRLHGTRLPKGYTIILRLPSNEIIRKPTARRKSRQKAYRTQSGSKNADSDDDEEEEEEAQIDDQGQDAPEDDLDTDSDEDVETRASNAYPGSVNNIGSIHQRHWFLQLDRQNSGFILDKTDGGKGTWIKGRNNSGFDPFFVRGRDHERSVVTGRLAKDVESDEGVEGFIGRGGWTGIDY